MTHPSPKETMSREKAKMLLKLIKEHKKACDKSDCGISTYLFLEEFERLKGRKATSKEIGVFL